MRFRYIRIDEVREESGAMRVIALGWALLVALTIVGCEKPREQAGREAGITTIEVWYPFGSDQVPYLKEIVNDFESEHPKIRVNMSFASNNLTSSQKLFLAI